MNCCDIDSKRMVANPEIAGMKNKRKFCFNMWIHISFYLHQMIRAQFYDFRRYIYTPSIDVVASFIFDERQIVPFLHHSIYEMSPHDGNASCMLE
jgi:hypothetical protein